MAGKKKGVCNVHAGGTGDARILISGAVEVVHPVVGVIATNLSEIDRISIVRISPGLLQASSESTGTAVQRPVTTPGHPTAIGVSLILDLDVREVQFYEITSAVRGYRGRMVDAVLRDLPEGWTGVVLMDWSSGFWERMAARHANLMLM